MHLLVVTDVDGTLLDHTNYGFAPARPALDALAAAGVPVILASSKTAAEIIPLQAQMGLTGLPAIVENGAGMLGTGADAGAQGAYAQIRAVLNRLPEELRAGFRGFGDMSPAEVAAVTGLTLAGGAAAQDRAFSEPGVFDGPDEAAFVAALAQSGVHARRGGRFLTLSHGRTKADAMDALAAQMGTRKIVALGDAPNDAEMLEAADIGVVIRNDAGTAMPPLRGKDIRHSRAEGPEGWCEMIFEILQEHAT